MIQSLLRERGIPSIEQRERGFDVPDFLAAGPRAILVPPGMFDAAREVLGDEPADDDGVPLEGESSQGARAPLLRLVAAVIAVVLLVGGIALVVVIWKRIRRALRGLRERWSRPPPRAP